MSLQPNGLDENNRYPVEHSVGGQTASNRGPSRRAWSLLGEACRRIAGRTELEPILAAAVEACGLERAFLIQAARCGPPRVDQWFGTRDDGDSRLSRGLLRKASESDQIWIRVGLDFNGPSGLGRSARDLALRTAIAVPLPGGELPRRRLLLDGRRAPQLPVDDLRALVGGFAALLASRRPPAQAKTSASQPSSGLLRGRSEAALALDDWVDRAAPTRLPVLILGESGSGKELVAREIHARSPRAAAPFVGINCAAFSETLLEAELFGAQRGAYTGADRSRPGLFRRADGGSLFLDEVGDMPAAMQAKLLRAVQEGRVRPVGSAEEVAVDVRIIAATHRALDADRFRPDLRYRLAVVTVEVPPLRQRGEDLPLIVERLGIRLADETGLGPLRVEPCALERLRGYSWPGNVRELHAVLARALLRSRGAAIRAHHFGDDLQPQRNEPNSGSSDASDTPLERRMIVSALEQARGSIADAARAIGWTRQKLYRRIDALAIPRR